MSVAESDAEEDAFDALALLASKSAPSEPEPPSAKYPKSSEHLTLHIGPSPDQVKDFSLIPSNIIRVNTSGLRSDDYISITLLLDPRFRAQSPNLTDRIFIMGVPALYGLSEGAYWKLPSLRISQEMLPGRTKGFRFRLSYRLISSEKVVDEIFSDPFTLWTNVNQKGFPKEQREHMISQRTKTNKKKRKRPNADLPMEMGDQDGSGEQDEVHHHERKPKPEPKPLLTSLNNNTEPGPYGPRRRGRGAGLAAAIAAAAASPNASDDE